MFYYIHVPVHLQYSYVICVEFIIYYSRVSECTNNSLEVNMTLMSVSPQLIGLSLLTLMVLVGSLLQSVCEDRGNVGQWGSSVFLM